MVPKDRRGESNELIDFKTTDLCDEFEESVLTDEPLLRDYGGTTSFCGRVATVRVFEDNVLVRETLETDGQRRVLVVDGGGSTRRALLGDRLALLAHDNGWAGIVVNGCIRDSTEIAGTRVGVKALHAVPRKSSKKGIGERDIPVRFARITFTPGTTSTPIRTASSSRTGICWLSASGSYVSNSGLPAVSEIVRAAKKETAPAARR
jgi:regulator of ribonuclease activity A